MRRCQVHLCWVCGLSDFVFSQSYSFNSFLKTSYISNRQWAACQFMARVEQDEKLSFTFTLSFTAIHFFPGKKRSHGGPMEGDTYWIVLWIYSNCVFLRVFDHLLQSTCICFLFPQHLALLIFPPVRSVSLATFSSCDVLNRGISPANPHTLFVRGHVP